MARKGKALEQILVEKAEPSERKQVEADLKKAEVERKGFSGFKADLKFTSPEFSVTTPIRYEKLTAKDVQEKLKVVSRVGKIEVGRTTTPHEWGYFAIVGRKPNGDPIYDHNRRFPETDVKHFQILPDGGEVEVQPFPRTKTLEIKKLLPATSLSEFLVDSSYELWSEGDPAQLLGFAEYLSRKDSLAVSKISFGRGFKESYALIYPLFQDGKFVLVMALTQKRAEYKHWMPVDVKPAAKSIASAPASVLEEI